MLFYMGVKFGFSPRREEYRLRILGTGCWGWYLDPYERKYVEDGDNCIVRWEIMSRIVRWAGYVARMWKMRKAYSS
jgi:hypothetical protein